MRRCGQYPQIVYLQYLTSTTLERQAGSSQYASFVCVALAIHAVIQNLERQKGPLTNGPLPCLFASMTLYILETPSVQKFTLMGVQLTEQVGQRALTAR